MTARRCRVSPAPCLHWEGKHDPSPPRVCARRELLKFEAHTPAGMLIRADARDAAAHLLESLESRVNLIYLDPPFLVGSDFLATVPGPAREDARCFAFSDRWPGQGAYLNLMRDVLVLSHRMLCDDGVIYVHVDQRASHWIRCIMQEIFGVSRDRGVIAWHMGNGVKARRQWGCAHNDILCFSKGQHFRLRSDRAALREPFAEGSVKTHFRSVDEYGRRYRLRQINGRDYRYYADEGRAVGSVWTDCPSMSARSPILDQSTGYPTQKPERLLERIIQASSDPGDLVVDLFCGSGTTPAVAQRLGRRWIAGDAGRLAVETTLARLLALEIPPGVEVIDLACHDPDSLLRLTRLLQLQHIETEPRLVRGRLDRHRVLVTNQPGKAESPDCDWAFLIDSTSAPITDPPASHARVWRCHPESPSSASLGPVVFASDFALDARLDADGRLQWSICAQHLRQNRDGQLEAADVKPDSVVSWALLAGGRLFAAGRGRPPERIDPEWRCADSGSALTLRVVDAYGFDGLCAVEHDRPHVSVPSRRTRPSRRAL
ncbi:MAG: site-specific DNA-methyltransferase [Leptolyngbya sp. PLA3]|nr:MAG: site-specific DNA-methyltransferase [Cyanobacteria bacterium CYA]MCE7967949.1 site-specific DNA-methyltransferase [Leptolyngbya sp. PL-A3]